MRESGAIKKPALAGFFGVAKPPRSGCLTSRSAAKNEGLDAGVDAALVAGGLVAMDQATRGVTIEDRHGGLERGFGAGVVAGFDRLVRSMERWLVLRALRTTVCLARFLADLMLATAVS